MLFETRGVYMTNGVQAKVDRGELDMLSVMACLDKHFENKGEESKYDNLLNVEAIQSKSGRVFSIFNNVKGNKLYVITEGLHLLDDPVYGDQYPYTTVLFPDEY